MLLAVAVTYFVVPRGEQARNSHCIATAWNVSNEQTTANQIILCYLNSFVHRRNSVKILQEQDAIAASVVI